MDAVLFWTFALIAVACAVNLIWQRHPIASAISLIGVMGSLAVLYLLLGAEFIAAVQVIIYAGAIMVLFVFVIMLLNAGREERTPGSRLARYLGLPLLATLVIQMGYLVARPTRLSERVELGSFATSTKQIGRELFGRYLLPFEVTSILILAAIVGAVALARRQDPAEGAGEPGEKESA